MNLTISEFSTLFPEYAGRAASVAARIPSVVLERQIRSETAYPEKLLYALCFMQELEEHLAANPIIDSPQASRSEQREAAIAAVIVKRGSSTVIGGDEYWKRKIRISEDQHKDLSRS